MSVRLICFRALGLSRPHLVTSLYSANSTTFRCLYSTSPSAQDDSPETSELYAFYIIVCGIILNCWKYTGVGDETGNKDRQATEMNHAFSRTMAQTETITTSDDLMRTGHPTEVLQKGISEEALETVWEKASEKFHGMIRHWRKSRRTSMLRQNP